MNIFRRILLALICFIPLSTAISQNWIGGMVSTDTLYAGQTNVILMNSGFHQADQLVASIQANFCLDEPQRCQDCYTDTLRTSDIESLNDTLVKITFDIPAYAFPVEWDLSLSNGMGYYPMQMFTRAYIVSQPFDNTVCLGGNARFDICAYGYRDLDYDWYHNGNLVQSEYMNPVLEIENVGFADTGMYYCVMEDWTNQGTHSDTVYLHLKKIPDQQDVPEGPAFISYNQGPVIYKIRRDELITGYNWVLMPENAGHVDNIYDTVVVSWDRDFSGQAFLFVETTLGECPGLNSDTLWIDVAGKPETQEICIVGIDDTTENCRVVWNKSADPKVRYYNIYRESNQAGIFLKLVSISAADLSIYVDSASRPEWYPHSYKMSVTDTSGIESQYSKIHTTMLLVVNRDIDGFHNLEWSHYQGFPFLSYEIYRGLSRDSMIHMNTITSNVNLYKDLTSPLASYIYYQVIARNPDGCVPTMKSGIDYSASRSNTARIHYPLGILENYRSNRLNISPNPTFNTLRIQYSGTWKGAMEATLLNLLGQEQDRFLINSSDQEIDVSMLEPGMYLLRLKEPAGFLLKKLIIRR